MEVTDTCKNTINFSFMDNLRKKILDSYFSAVTLKSGVNKYLDISQGRQDSHEKNAPWIIKCQVSQKICDF